MANFTNTALCVAALEKSPEPFVVNPDNIDGIANQILFGVASIILHLLATAILIALPPPVHADAMFRRVKNYTIISIT
jgi:hypothetical protein